MLRRMFVLIGGASMVVLAGCSESATPATDAGGDSGVRLDGGPSVDAGPAADAGPRVDAGPADDGGPSVDAGPADAGGPSVDAGPADAGGPSADAGANIDGGPSTARGDCAVDADCPGGVCIELVPGGYRVCRVTPVPATGCEPGRPDACCTTADCISGTCFLGPIHRSCGGAVRLPTNECGVDECATDSDCTVGVCAPAGTFAPVASCVSASCFVDADCVAEAGGHCVVSLDPCCSIPVGLVCSYDSDGCTTSADCVTGYCQVTDGRARCTGGPGPFCPL